LLSINPSLEAEFLLALRVFDGQILLARPVDFQAGFFQCGDNIFPATDKPLFHFGCEIGMHGFLGLCPIILARIFAPADEPSLV
jgi:hypothetical protein